MTRQLTEYDRALLKQLLADSTPDTLSKLSNEELQDTFDCFSRIPESFETVLLLGRIAGEAQRRKQAPQVDAHGSADRLALDLLVDVMDPQALARMTSDQLQECFDLIALIPEGKTQSALYLRILEEGHRRLETEGRKVVD